MYTIYSLLFAIYNSTSLFTITTPITPIPPAKALIHSEKWIVGIVKVWNGF